MSKNIIYVAKCIDLATGKLTESSKIGIAQSDADKRIRALNSTKQPFKVELEAAWSFEKSSLSAEVVEAAIHALLEPDRINGEWFRDSEQELADRVGKAVLKLGGTPIGDDNPELKEMNRRQKVSKKLMESVMEPLRERLLQIGINWDYLTSSIGIDSGIGRLRVRITQNRGLYIRRRYSKFSAELLKLKTGLDWRDGERDGRVMCSGVDPDQLVTFLETTKDWLKNLPSPENSLHDLQKLKLDT